MSSKSKIVSIIITLMCGIVLVMCCCGKKSIDDIKEVYQIYLDGQKIGIIENSEDLYSLINEEQSNIKEKYDVDQVYPPNGFSITNYYTYDDSVVSAEYIYDKIKNNNDFTIKGYTITVTSSETEEEDAKTLFRINVLDEQIFEDAISKLIKSFISEEKYNEYLNNSQTEIVDTGSMIENIYFEENISIKEAYISTDEKIYTDADELSRFLLFGEDAQEQEYTVKAGDTISSIAEDNELNVSEFLVANPTYNSENNLLAVGDTVIISLINPMLTLVYDMYIVEDISIPYETEIKYDYSKSTSYRKVETAGVNGVQRVAKHTQVINGDYNQGAKIDSNTWIKPVVNQVIVKGARVSSSSYQGVYVDTGTNWAWPTNYPYTISSYFGTRYLFNRTAHEGIDISGTGYGSPIYAVYDGTVVASGWNIAGSSGGIAIIIQHPNGYYSLYAHLSATYVSAGDTVTRKQKIAAMGNTGQVTGTHLHLSISQGRPYSVGGYKWINPLDLWK